MTEDRHRNMGSRNLARLIRQLWGPAEDAGHVRVVVGQGSWQEWQVAHEMRLVPRVSNPMLLVSQGGGTQTAKALNSYGGLRRPYKRIVRKSMAAMQSFQVPISRVALRVLVAPGSQISAVEPLHLITGGSQPFALIGVRSGANAKPTVQLFDSDGLPNGYAKVSWSPLTRTFVEKEREVLLKLQGRSGLAYVPELVDSGRIFDRPYVKTKPLPADAHALRGSGSMTIAELASLHTVHRRGTVDTSSQFRKLVGHFQETPHTDRASREVAEAAIELAAVLTSVDLVLPIATRWHGDLVPWNAARDAKGAIWLWDWETSEEDALVGLDTMHWMMNADGPVSELRIGESLQKAASQATTHLQAAGLGPKARSVVSAAYALSIADRGISLAAANSGWQDNRVTASSLMDLLRAARYLLQSATVSE